MQKKFSFYPGKLSVVFRKGPLGFLLQEPSAEAQKIKDDPSLQDKSAPMRDDLVHKNALAVVRQRGGDATDHTELMGDYILQFGKYKGMSYRWLLQNDVGYTLYLIKGFQKEKESGTLLTEGHGKVSLLTFVKYALSFKEIQSILSYEASGAGAATASSDDDQLVGFGSRAKSTWKEIWDSRGDGYADFIIKKTCLPGTKMKKLQQYLLKKQQSASCPPLAGLQPCVPPKTLVMDEDEELESAMLSISPSKLLSRSMPASEVTDGASEPKRAPGAKSVPSATVSRAPDTPATQKEGAPDGIKTNTPVALPPELSFLKETASASSDGKTADSLKAHSSQPPVPVIPVPLPERDINSWNCSQHQKQWMKMEMQDLGLWPGSRPVRNLGNAISLWRLPPQPELVDTVAALPSPNFFQLHPFFIWKPESEIMARLRNTYLLPCLHGCLHPQVVSAGVGRPRVIVGTSGQYYMLSSRLCCKACRKFWFADSPRWLEKLPRRFTNLLPAFLTYKKAICKSVIDELRRTGKSPTDMANQVNELMHLKYERAHLAYLQAIESVWDSESGVHGQKTMGQFVRKDNTPNQFSHYQDPNGWSGVTVSGFYLADCLLEEYRRQEPALSRLLQGTFGQVFRSDHTRKVARKVTLTSGIMSSYAVMNENWQIVSWVMVQSETERSLEPMYQGMARRYSEAGVEKAGFHWVDRDCCASFRIPESIPGEHLQWVAWKTTPSIIMEATSGPLTSTCASRCFFNRDILLKLDLFHCLRRFSRECTSEHHPLYGTFCQLLSAAFTVVDQEDLKKLKAAYEFCGIRPANPTKQHTREHCRTKIPQPMELLDRVEKVIQHFHLAKDPNDVPLFKPSMLKMWRIQRVHILRRCLSDPELKEGIMYRYGGTLQLNHVPGEGAKVPVWIPVRGTSQQEGYHFHQAQWITGTQVSTELFQAQGMTGVARWNYQRLVDLKQPGVILPAVFDPVLIGEINSSSKRVTGQEKYPVLSTSDRDTGERFGLDYREPGCRPVPLDWDKHRTVKREPSTPTQQLSTQLFESDQSQTQDSSGMASPPPAAVSLCYTVPVMQETQCTIIPDLQLKTDVSLAPPLPLRSSPRAARVGPIKTGGRIFVLDHTRWTSSMKDVIGGLLTKYHGEKDILKLVDLDYASIVQRAATDPNSMLHPTTRTHISRYVKHLAKLINTSTSLITSPEKLRETQTLWHCLTEGSESVHVPVVTIEPATFNPPAPAVSPPVTQDSIEKIVEGILSKQQQQQEQKKRHTKTCLSCGQPKSRYETDGSISIHFFYQQGPVRYFYCSKKVHETYAAEGLSNTKMSFEEFSTTEFFQRELKATKARVEEKSQKRRRGETEPTGRVCRFCHKELKQGPNSPHIHTGFPGVPGKYIYCPSKVYFIYKPQGMTKEMGWKEFCVSPFYEAEKQRWVAERKK